MHYPAIVDLVAKIQLDKRSEHPLFQLNAAQDEVSQRRAIRVEQAISKARRLFPCFAARKEQSLVEGSDLNNVAAILGEFRALSDLAGVFGTKVETPLSGSDFVVTGEVGELRVEVVTPSGSIRKRDMFLEESRRENVTIRATATAPFGFPTEERPGDTIQGNAVSRLSSLKQSEHQADLCVPSILWIDLENDQAFPISIGASQAQPFTSSNEALASGAAWWANYGAKGDPIYDHWSLVTEERRSYVMEFDGRFQRNSRYVGVVNVIDGEHIFHENPRPATQLAVGWVIRLLSLPGARFEHCWTDWPIEGSLAARVQLARSIANTLSKSQSWIREGA